MTAVRRRVTSEVIKRGYTDDEVLTIYELARFLLEAGDIRRAEAIILGLIEVVPEFSLAWLAQAYIQTAAKDYEGALESARQALKCEPDLVQAQMYLVVCAMILGDYNTAGTYLGEVGEKVENGEIFDQTIIRFFNAQLARFQQR